MNKLIKKTKVQVVIAFITLAVGIFTIFAISYQIPVSSFSTVNARFFPYLLSFVIVLLGIINIIGELKQKINEAETDGKETQFTDISQVGRVFFVFIALVLWLIFINVLGFIVVTILLTASTMLIIGNQKWLQICLTSLIVPFALYFLFTDVLRIVLP